MWRNFFYRDIEKKIKSLSTWYQDKGTNYILETNVTEARVENVDGNICGGAYSIGIQKRELKAYRLGIKTTGQTILKTNVTEARVENDDGNICGRAYSIGIQQRKFKSLST